MKKNALKETYAVHKTGRLQMNIYETSSYIPYHWHDEYEFICVTDGECECIVNGKSITVKKGCAILIYSGELHTVNSGTNGRFFAVVFHPYLVCGSDSNEFFSGKIIFRRIYDSGTAGENRIVSALLKMHESFHIKKSGFELRLKALLTGIFADIYENGFYSLQPGGRENSFEGFGKILEYVHENCCSHITLSDIAAFGGFTPSYMITLFKNNTGKTPIEYINAYRIYRAKELLTQTDKSVLEISEECGFENVGYFIRLFKKSTEKTPLQYRRGASVCVV